MTEENPDDFRELHKLVLKRFLNLSICISIVLAIYIRVDIWAPYAQYRAQSAIDLDDHLWQTIRSSLAEFAWRDSEFNDYSLNYTNTNQSTLLHLERFMLTVDYNFYETNSVCSAIKKKKHQTNEILNSLLKNYPECKKQAGEKIYINTDGDELPVKDPIGGCSQSTQKNIHSYQLEIEKENFLSRVFRYVFFDSGKSLPIRMSYVIRNRTQYDCDLTYNTYFNYKCIRQNQSWDAMHLEINLYNFLHDQLVYVYVNIPKWEAEKLSIRFIDLKRSFLVLNGSILEYVPAIVILFAFFYYTVSIVKQSSYNLKLLALIF